MRNITTSLFLLLCIQVSSAVASNDRLVQPALIQSEMDKVLLLAIDKAGERLVAVGEQGTIIYSDDGGRDWLQATVPSSTLITDVHFFDRYKGWAVGHDGVVLATQDGGEHWDQLLDGKAINEFRVDALKQSLARLQSATGTDQEAYELMEYQLDDALVALEEGPSTPLLDVFFLDHEVGYALGAYGLFLKTVDAGQSWIYEGHLLPNPESFHLNKIYRTKNGNLLVMGEAGVLFESNDVGESWVAVDTPYQGSFFSAVESDALYLMGLRGNVFRRTEGNTSESRWEQVDIGMTATINDSVVVNGDAYLVGQGGAVLRQEGQGFKPFSQRGLRSFSGVEVSEGSLITVGEGGVGKIQLNGVVK